MRNYGAALHTAGAYLALTLGTKYSSDVGESAMGEVRLPRNLPVGQSVKRVIGAYCGVALKQKCACINDAGSA